MRLYTRTGDDGTTSLFDGKRVPKDHPRVAAYGDVDELNAAIGLAITALRMSPAAGSASVMLERLVQIQSELFIVGSDLATPLSARQREKAPCITAENVKRLE